MTDGNTTAPQPFLCEESAECPPRIIAAAQELASVRVAVVNATTARVIDSALRATELGITTPILIGPKEDIEAAWRAAGRALDGIEIFSADNPEDAASQAVQLAASGDVDVILKGDVSTDVLLRAVLDRNAGLRTDRLLSHVFQMTMPGCDRALYITDAVLNVQPSREASIDIANNAIALMRAVGINKPRMAVLSASEKASDAMPSTQDAAWLKEQAEAGEMPNAIVDGPMALDLALSTQAADIKDYSSDVAGRADAVLVPNIETGNALFKSMVYLRGATAAGLVLGAKVPVALTSRADPVAARITSLALASIYVHRNTQN